MTNMAVSDQKKRGLDALERRFAAAKAQSEQPKPHPTDETKSLLSVCTAQRKPTPKFAATSNSPCPVDGENHPVYTEISESIHEKLLQAPTMESSRKKDTAERIVRDMIQKGEDSGKKGKNLKRENWVLLDNFISKDDKLENAREDALRSHSKRSKNHMSMKQHRKCSSFNFPKEFHNFERFKPMNEMWKEYISEVVKEKGKKPLTERFLSADLHGAFLSVVESKIASYRGKSGIMVRETIETFGIISQDNHFTAVPKAGSVFIVQVDFWKITLLGDRLSAKERLKENKVQQSLQSLVRS